VSGSSVGAYLRRLRPERRNSRPRTEFIHHAPTPTLRVGPTMHHPQGSLGGYPVSSAKIETSMKAPEEGEFQKTLESDGFSHIYVWQDGPHAHYSDHTHAGLTAHIILDGEMTLTMGGASKTYRVGERCDVPAGAVHSARMGPTGCRYLIGEK
jgi:mannose-6-phosphate isomerase-like protein (cupin superfamily)